MNIILIGAPGSGKGTQAKKISAALGFPIVSTGDALRKELEASSEIGLFAKNYINKGELVPDDIIVKIVKNRLKQQDCQKGFILDGFPRNIDQVNSLDDLMNQLNKNIDLVVNFDVADDVVIKRILGRFSCKACGANYNKFFVPTKKEGVCDLCQSTSFESRIDDNQETISNRLSVYKNSISVVIEKYKSRGILKTFDASIEPGELFEKIKNFI